MTMKKKKRKKKKKKSQKQFIIVRLRRDFVEWESPLRLRCSCPCGNKGCQIMIIVFVHLRVGDMAVYTWSESMVGYK